MLLVVGRNVFADEGLHLVQDGPELLRLGRFGSQAGADGLAMGKVELGVLEAGRPQTSAVEVFHQSEVGVLEVVAREDVLPVTAAIVDGAEQRPQKLLFGSAVGKLAFFFETIWREQETVSQYKISLGSEINWLS